MVAVILCIFSGCDDVLFTLSDCGSNQTLLRMDLTHLRKYEPWISDFENHLTQERETSLIIF